MAGLLKQDAGHVNVGNVTYNGRTKDSKEFSLPKLVHFVEQVSEGNIYHMRYTNFSKRESVTWPNLLDEIAAVCILRYEFEVGQDYFARVGAVLWSTIYWSKLATAPLNAYKAKRDLRWIEIGCCQGA